MTTDIIIGVAIKYNDSVIYLPKPYRHHHIIHNVCLLGLGRLLNSVQGFITEDEIFVDRREALELVLKHQQYLILPVHNDKLYSENVWGTPGDWQAPAGSHERRLYDYFEDPERIARLLKVK